ncbi:MAG: serine hydrolase domain-containing protein, partial [Lacipirellulaceae bacterium]
MHPFLHRTLLVVGAMQCWCVPQLLLAQDLSALTELAEGAILGENVADPVPGFDIRILKDGQPIFHQAFGNWTIDQPARADSSTKTLSGALMMSLAESAEGGFSLESHLSDFLPEYDKEGYRDITIRQAFSHTSGLPSEGGTSPILIRTDITLRQAAWLISFRPLENGPPGSTFGYGGISMHAAGAAAEVATGESFVDLMAERITGPLEMANTRFVTASDANPRVAGGMESTASEFSRFMDMLLNGGEDRVTGTRILSEDSVEEMFTRVTEDTTPIDFSPVENNRYGIGV